MWLPIICFLLILQQLNGEEETRNAADKLKGHLEAIGSQGTFLGNIPELKFSPDGKYFYKNFIHGREPVVIRNAASHWLAVKNWPNETYLNLTYGELPFTVHMYKVYRDALSVRKDMNLSHFLEIYKEQSVYLDSPFPPSNLINEISLPSILQCKEISSTISDVYLLMSSGNTSSPLHHDGYENILAIISGTKKVILFKSSYSENVYADEFNVLPGLSPIDPEKVDLEKFPKFADVMYYESVLNPGDILYIPQYWWHHVTSAGAPNIAINIWFDMFNYEEQFESAGLKESQDVVKTTELFEKLAKEEPQSIECKEQAPALDQALKIVLNDSSSESLRIPKVAKRPADFKLISGYTMPPLGFGTAGLHPDDRLPVILTALDEGYRLFDTAQIYGTEVPLGAAIKERNIPRDDVTIVTKLHPQYHGYESTISAVQESLENLQTDYIDVFLIHTKYCDGGYFKCPEGKPEGTWQDSWRAMEHLHDEGKIRSLGVSNFDVIDLRELVNFTKLPVSVVQNWFDPFHQDENVREFCGKHRIHYMGYSTLGSQWTTYGGLESNPVLTSATFFEIASHYEFVVAQVILRWAIHLNITVIPRSHDPRHILLNFKTLDMELSEHEIKLITEEWLPSTSQGTEQESESLGTNDEEPADLEGPEAREENDDNHVTSDGNKDEL
ncbi:Prostaglandin F synthase [Paramuricea clavata]|uniref:Prostaglandin F synthase n=1 Tax=Paramuricea clavata TaxID=317549 RepID=A0A7D9J5X0_PARCT|nr:Prostaglandin F synthase [Paramuricea clavata]